MERKSFERGTVVGGIVRVLISVVAIVVASIVMATAIRTWEADEAGGKIFQCVIAGILILAGVVFIINGVQMIRNGKKSFEVTKKGHSERGRILDLTVTEVTENNNGAVFYPATITVDEQSRRFTDMSRQWGGGFQMPEHRTLTLNEKHPLVKYISEHEEGADTAMMCQQLYDLAMLAHKPLSPEEMTQFIARSNEIMLKLAGE